MDLMEKTLHREILRAAVGRQIFCKLTEVVLDAKKSVLLEVKRGPVVVATAVYDSKAWDTNGPGIIDVLSKRNLTTEVTDGRKLWERKSRNPKTT